MSHMRRKGCDQWIRELEPMAWHDVLRGRAQHFHGQRGWLTTYSLLPSGRAGECLAGRLPLVGISTSSFRTNGLAVAAHAKHSHQAARALGFSCPL